MGEQTVTNTQPAAVRRLKKNLRNSMRVDLVLVAVVLALLVFGLIMVYSSSWSFSILRYDSTGDAAKRQLMWAVAGLAIGTVCLFIDYHFYKYLAIPIMVITCITLIAVLVFPSGDLDTRGTIFGRSVQPSELAKIGIVIYLSVWLNSKRDNLKQISFGLLPLALIVGFVGGLIAVQPDISAAISIVVLGGVLFFMADSDLRQIALLVIVILLAGAIVIGISENGRTRVTDYWNGLQDISTASDHIQYSFRAIVEGGLFGKGLGKGTIKVIGLPVAWTDSIYSVIAEEFGLVGAIGVLAMYILVWWRGVRIAHHAPDKLGKLLAGGITFWIIFEALLNICVMVNLLPFAGNPLPLISTGGSNLISTLAAVGILLNISRQGVDVPVDERSEKIAAYRRSRRNRRRDLSSHSHSSSAQIE